MLEHIPPDPPGMPFASLEDLDELKSLPCASPQWTATALRGNVDQHRAGFDLNMHEQCSTAMYSIA